MGPHRHLNLQIPRRAAVDAGVALAADGDDLPVVNAAGYVDADGHRLAHLPASRAGGAGAFDNFALAVAAGAGGLGLNNPDGGALLPPLLAGAVAVRAGLDRRALFRPAASAVAAGAGQLHRHLLFAAFGRLFKRDNHRGRHIAAAPGGVGIGAPAAAGPAEEGGENIPQIEIHPVEPGAAVTARAEIRVHARMAKLVIPALLLRVGQHLVGLVDLLEACLRLLVPGI